jgi:hypothetical protein
MAISRKDPSNVLHESIRDNCDILKGLDGEPKKSEKMVCKAILWRL